MGYQGKCSGVACRATYYIFNRRGKSWKILRNRSLVAIRMTSPYPLSSKPTCYVRVNAREFPHGCIYYDVRPV